MKIRMLSWNIVMHLVEPRVLRIYKSVVELALNVIMSPNEAYGVVICASKVLIKALEIYEEESDFSQNEPSRNSEDQINEEEESLNPKQV